MKKFFICMFALSSIFYGCSKSEFLNDSNIDSFENLSEEIIGDDEILYIKNKNSLLSAVNTSHENIDISGKYEDFLIEHNNVTSVTKESYYPESYIIRDKNLYSYFSDECLEQSDSAERFLIEHPDLTHIIFISFTEKDNIFFESANRYVYSPDLDLSECNKKELHIFGFAFAKKLKYENWFYIGMLG